MQNEGKMWKMRRMHWYVSIALLKTQSVMLTLEVLVNMRDGHECSFRLYCCIASRSRTRHCLPFRSSQHNPLLTTNQVQGEWSEFGACTKSCGGGTQRRTCVPRTKNGVRNCEGQRTQPCNEQACPIGTHHCHS